MAVVSGLISRRSSGSPAETMARLVAAITSKGLTIFARIDHSAGAAQAGLELRPTEVVIFGNAKGGTPLMQASQTLGIDLPLRALVWQDEAGTTWLSYNDPVWLATRHDANQAQSPATLALSHGIEALINLALA